MLINTTECKSIPGTSDLSILDSALSAGLVFDYSCKNGQCGACKTTLLEGEVVELRPQISLTDVERKNDKILSCCCSPVTDVLIDAEDLTVLKDIEIKTFPARINKIAKKAEQIVEIELRLPPNSNLKFLEGQYIDVIGPEGRRRSYSIASSTKDKHITLWIKKVADGLLSKYWFYEAKENDLLRIEGPKGTFYFRGEKKRVILLATGTGIAPIKSILDKLSETINELEITLYWGNRSPEEFFWEPSYPNLNLTFKPILSKPHDSWDGEIGYVQNVAVKIHSDIENTQVYACGSIAMIQSAKEIFLRHGLGENNFYSDAFVSS